MVKYDCFVVGCQEYVVDDVVEVVDVGDDDWCFVVDCVVCLFL